MQTYIPSQCGPVPCVVAGDFNFDMHASGDMAKLGLCVVPPPARDGVTYELERNALAAKRAEHDDTTAMLDAVAINQRNPQCVFHACCRVVRPRNPDGTPFTDHEVVVAVILAQHQQTG